MKKLIATGVLVAAISFSFTGVASADNPNWEPEKAEQVAVNRCANAGIGNDGEIIWRGNCRDPFGNKGEQAPRDLDPGNSGDHNANNTK